MNGHGFALRARFQRNSRIAAMACLGLLLSPALGWAQFGSGGVSGLRFFGRSGGFATVPRAQEGEAPLAQRAEQLRQGQLLFHRDWQKSGPLVSANGDGLGPMYNAVSCVACHKQGSNGGGGDSRFNVDLLTVSARPSQVQSATMLERLARIHPGFVTVNRQFNSTVILHASRLNLYQGAQDYGEPDGAYSRWRADLLKMDSPSRVSASNPHMSVEGIRVRLVQRNTPALFGLGLIDAIPDHVLVAIADEQKKDHPEIKGRIARDSRGGVGRFGWRGQIGHLHEFVLGACANELGLQVPGNAQPSDVVPVGVEGTRMRVARNGKDLSAERLDLTSEQCLSLTSFVAGLMPPTRSSSGSVQHAREITAGEKLFTQVGCADCHRPAVGSVEGLYSDLLLHDMGAELGDPIGANADNGGSFNVNTYYGSADPAPPQIAGKGTNTQQEWRTPPLWGVSDSGPWLHDGRATTLEEAIRLHGGQGRRSARQFAALPRRDRNQIFEFLGSLAAPRIDGTTPSAVIMTPATFPTIPPGGGFSGSFFPGGFR